MHTHTHTQGERERVVGDEFKHEAVVGGNAHTHTCPAHPTTQQPKRAFSPLYSQEMEGDPKAGLKRGAAGARFDMVVL